MTAYTSSSAVYDAINASRAKDYVREVDQVHELIEQHKRSKGNMLLDVACGTGGHLQYLQAYYSVEGLDLSADMLAVARQRFPTIRFYEASMLDFELGRQYDVITCLFSSVGYVVTVENMRKAVGQMVKHLLPGGVLVIEPYFYPETYRPGSVSATFVNEPDLKIARMAVHEQCDGISVMNMQFLVATPKGIDHFSESHKMGLFPFTAYDAALQDAGLTVSYDPKGLIGRGLFAGVKPLDSAS